MDVDVEESALAVAVTAIVVTRVAIVVAVVAILLLLSLLLLGLLWLGLSSLPAGQRLNRLPPLLALGLAFILCQHLAVSILLLV